MEIDLKKIIVIKILLKYVHKKVSYLMYIRTSIITNQTILNFFSQFQTVDKVEPMMFSLVGNLLYMLAFMFIGPIPKVGLESNVFLIQVKCIHFC